MFDMHCHLGFLGDEEIALISEHPTHNFLNMTVEPKSLMLERNTIGGNPNVKTGVGLHPRWILNAQQTEQDLQLLKEAIKDSSLIGEIGLDYLPKYCHLKKEQQYVFKTIMDECALRKDKVVSIHALRSTKDVLSVLDDANVCQDNVCILHWFSGSSDELHQAIRLGCWFSVNQNMLQTKKGKEYIKVIPNERLLLESDMPSDPMNESTLTDIVNSLKECNRLLENLKKNYDRDVIEQNSKAIFNLC